MSANALQPITSAHAVPPSQTTPTEAPKHPPTRRITLVKQHIHAGLPHRPGDVIDLDRDLADWLVAEGAATINLPDTARLKHLNHKEQ